MKKVEKVGLDRILEEIKIGLSPAKISKKYNIPKQNISYFVGKLKKKGCIQKKGYGVWEYIKPFKEVKDLTTRQYDKLSLTSPKKEIRGHAYIWKIEFINPYDWERATRNYSKKKLTFQLMKHNKILRTIFQNRKIWLGKKGMTIYEPIDFMGRSSFEVRGKAIFEMDLLIKNLINELGLKFRPYRFTTSREHYGIIKNELARQYNDRKEKMHIKSDDGTTWMWIDDSKGLGELENDEPNISRQVQNFWNNHKKNKFKVDADFVLNGFDKTNKAIQETDNNIKETSKKLDYYAENQVTHVGLMKRITERIDKMDERDQKFLKAIEKLGKKL